jgi:hypothetical protein
LRKSVFALVGVAALASASGCIVAPLEPRPIAVGPPRVYMAPTYASPGVGWAWDSHPTYGYGWRHPDHGWHRGWR